MTNIAFRRAEDADAQCVFRMYTDAIGGEFCVWNSYYPTMNEVDNDIKTGNLFIMEDNTTVIAAASIVPENEMDDLSAWKPINGKHGEIARVVVDKDYRGKGIAKPLVSEILKVLKSRGCATARLCVVKGHLPAIKTYLSLGFERVGEADMYGHSYDLMEFVLSAHA